MLDPYIWNSGILNIVCHFSRHKGSCFCDHFPCQRAYHIFRQSMPCDTVAEQKLLIKFITADLCKIITSRIKEHACDQAFRTVHCKRLARTDLLVKFQKTFLIICSRILFKTCKDLRFFAKQFDNFRICPDSQRTDQYGNRYFSCPVNTHIENVIGICLIFQPCSTVWNDGRGKQSFTKLIMRNGIINTGRTHKLTYDNTLCTIDHKSTGCCHKRQITHKDFMFIDFVCFFVVKPYPHLQRSSICGVTFFTLFDCVLHVFLA